MTVPNLEPTFSWLHGENFVPCIGCKSPVHPLQKAETYSDVRQHDAECDICFDRRRAGLRVNGGFL